MFKGILDIAGHPLALILMIALGGYFSLFPEYREGKGILDRDMDEAPFTGSLTYIGGEQQIQYEEQSLMQSAQYPKNIPAAYPVAATESLAKQDIMLQEGHWIGLEVIRLTPELADANKIQGNVEGVLVDEVTLLSARSGVLAGDVIVGIDGNRVRDLDEFLMATKMVKDMRYATITVFRNGGYIDIGVESPDVIGFAQMEAAPMILPGATSPHKYYGPCGRCHVIAPKNSSVNSAQLNKDLGDTLAQSPPPIHINSPLTHRYRGVCQNCHEIVVN